MDNSRKKLRLGDVLVNSGVISEEQLQKGLELQKGSGRKLGETLVDEGLVSEENITNALSSQLNLDVIDLQNVTVSEDILSLVPANILKKYKILPFEYSAESMNILRVAMADPMDMTAMDDITIITNLQVEPVVSTTRSIMLALDKYYGQAEVDSALEEYTREKEIQFAEQENMYSEDVNNSPIVQLVKNMIEQAVRQRSSDIHIEPMERQVRIRYRIDGALYEKATYNIRLLPAMVARIKIIGGMDISEKRKPQDGRIAITVDRRDYDIRVSILPTINGEKVVMRMTSKEGLTKDKENLGFSPEELDKFDRILKNPHGIILVTGPTGSGKSTTLYTALSELNTMDVNIITVEDPVEANMEGINQVHVNAKAGLTFASALRSILRQDPDIIMIGEIRDGETADIAVKAAITGHLVVSTLHTNGTASTVTRLIDMGLEPYLIGDALVGVIAQRLVRRLCPECKRLVYASDEEKRLLEVTSPEDLPIYEPVGCDACGGTGYMGRIGVYEIMPVTLELRGKISMGARANELKEQAISEGMCTLARGAAKLCVQGITSYKEALKIAYESE